MTDGHVTCPEARRTKNRRKHKAAVYQSASWKKAKAEYVKGKVCEWCGSTENLLPHHPWKNTPDDAYEDLYLSECVAVCGKCHFMFERRHKIICPVCKENYMPVDPTIDRCWSCHLKQHPEKVEKIRQHREHQDQVRKCAKEAAAAKRKALKAQHPCKHHRVGGKCGVSAIGSRCPYARTKAAKQCGDFVAKVGK